VSTCILMSHGSVVAIRGEKAREVCWLVSPSDLRDSGKVAGDSWRSKALEGVSHQREAEQLRCRASGVDYTVRWSSTRS